MTCKIARPSPQALFDRHLQMFSNTVLGGAPIVPESNEWHAASVNYAIAEEFYAISEQAWKARDPRYACCEDLIEMAATDGVYPLPAAPASGYVQITGTAGTALPANLEFTIGGDVYTSINQPARIGDDGKAVVRVSALVPGEAGNAVVATGTMNEAVAGVNRQVTVCGGSFCAGRDAETCEAFRSRYLARMAFTPRATNQWLMEKLAEWPCVTRVFQRAGSCCRCETVGGQECGCSDCGGKLEFHVMFDGRFPCGVAPSNVVKEVEDWLFGVPQGYGLGEVEVGICGKIVPVQSFEVDVFIDVADCASSTQVIEIQDTVRDFFGTIAPSSVVNGSSIQAIVAQIVGLSADVSVRFAVVDNSLAYGPASGNPDNVTNRAVYVTACGIEAECDWLPCLRDVKVNSAGGAVGGCS